MGELGGVRGMETNRRVIILNADLFLTDRAPKLDSKFGNVLVIRLHAQDGESKEGTLHIEAHVIIVETHDAVQTAKGALLYAGIRSLSCLANHLHNVITFAFISEVVTDKLERVAEGSDSSEANLEVFLLLPRTLDNGCEDGVGMADEAGPELGVLGFANEADCGQRSLLLMRGTFANILDKNSHQVGPLTPRKLDSRDSGDDLSGSGTSLCIR